MVQGSAETNLQVEGHVAGEPGLILQNPGRLARPQQEAIVDPRREPKAMGAGGGYVR